MTRDVALTVARTALWENHTKLDLILRTGMDLNSHAFFFRSMRDRLDRIINHFERLGAAEEHADIYQPLFMAYCLLRAAVVCKPVYRPCVQGALARLNDLAELLTAAPL